MDHIEAAMNPEYLSRVLKTPVDKVTVTFGSNPGDNYMCVIYGLKAELSSGEKKHLVVKAYPNQAARQQMLQMTNIFSKEYHVYNFWIKEFLKLPSASSQITLAVPPFLDGAAVDYATPKNSGEDAVQGNNNNKTLENFLLMEDVRHQGFRMGDRIKGLDETHINLILKELGKFHALGWAYKKRNGYQLLIDKFPYLEERMFKAEMMEQFKAVFDGILQAARKMVTEALGEDSEVNKNFQEFCAVERHEVMEAIIDPYQDSMQDLEDIMRVKTVFPPNFVKEPWITTCHGDCWVNNFLFRYEEDGKTPSEVCLLDFQMMRESCPTTDLAYFLFSSTDSKTRRRCMKDFLKLYHDTFLETCNELGVEPLPGFSEESLRIRFNQAKVFGLMMSLPLLFAVLKAPETAQDLDTIETEDMGEFFAQGMNLNDENSNLRTRLSELVTEFHEDGIL